MNTIQETDEKVTLRQDETVRLTLEGMSAGSGSSLYALPAGTVLDGRYEILRVIGQGGFGITYEAVHIHNGNHVAVKEYFCRDLCGRETTQIEKTGCNVYVLDDTLQQQFRSDLDRFLKEARTLHDFASDQSIVTVLDYFEANATAYIVMEYLDGITLRELIPKDGCWTMEKIVRCFGPVMESMERVHDAGVIHRDISPDNLMFMPDGTLKLLDFGAARKFSNMQTTHSVIFKPYFSAPEQRDERGVLGSWTDVYGMCSTMYFCLTGKEPVDMLSRLLHDDMKRPSSQGADILPQAERILMKGLELDRHVRVQNMGTLRTELEKVYPPITEDEKERQRVRRKRTQQIIAVAAAAVVLCAAVIGFVFRTRIRFHFIETRETVLNGDDMTPEEFAHNSERVRERVAVLAGKEGYLWEKKGQRIRFIVPEKVYEGQDPEAFVWAGISRRMVPRMNIRDPETQPGAITLGQDNPLEILHQEEDIKELKEVEGGEQLYFSEEGKKRFASILNVPDLSVEIVWDKYDEETGKGFERYTYDVGFTLGDGESILLSDKVESDHRFSFPLMVDQYTKSPLSAPFKAQSGWTTRWEDPSSTMLPGEYQCNVKEVPAPSVSVRYSYHYWDEPEEETGYDASILSFQAILKNRLDSMGLPYAVGVNDYNQFEYVVRLPLESIFYEELAHLGEKVFLYLGSDRDRKEMLSSSSEKFEIRKGKDENTFEIVLMTSGSNTKYLMKTLQTMQEQGKKDVYLYLDSIEIAAGDLEAAQKTLVESGEIRFTRWLFPRHLEMTLDTEHFAGLLSAFAKQDPQDSFHMVEEMEICGEDGAVLYFDERQPEKVYFGRVEELVQKWEDENEVRERTDMSIYGEERTLGINYYQCPVEDPAKSLLPFIELYERENLGAGGIDRITVNLYDTERGGEDPIHISCSLHSDFETNTMRITNMGSYRIDINSDNLTKWADLPDIYNSYLENTPFWKEKIADDIEKPIFTLQ